ncbi:MAG TPA: phospholipase D-like domain-containing protein, partial [Candidatus Elarobacter sp.]
MPPRAVTGHPFVAPPAQGDGKPATVAAGAAQLSAASSIVAHDGPLTVKAYRGDGCVLIAMDVKQSACAGLAGFAIARSTDGVTFTYAPNRLSFKPEKAVTAATTTEQRRASAETTDIAPYQKFRWVDYPPQTVDGPYTYRVQAMYFIAGKDPAQGTGALEPKATVTFALPLTGKISPQFDIAFTRGYVSSQAFVDRYGSNVKSLRFDDSVTYDTKQVVTGTSTTPPTTYKDMYRWLGDGARQLLSDFLVQCEKDGVATGSGYDVFAYDLDEPDFLRVLARDAERGWPIRMVLDDAPLHTKKGAREIEAAKLLDGSKVDVVRGHFKRFAHDKCVIQRDKAGNAVRVLTGSANFSVRGLYVQSNSMIVIDDPDVAKLYGQAFDQAFTAMGKFTSAPIAAKWFDFTQKPGL